MNTIRKLVQRIYQISMEELSANCNYNDHIDYICYRLNGGMKSEESWFKEQAEPTCK